MSLMGSAGIPIEVEAFALLKALPHIKAYALLSTSLSNRMPVNGVGCILRSLPRLVPTFT